MLQTFGRITPIPAMNEQRPTATPNHFFSAPLAETDPKCSIEPRRRQDGIERIAGKEPVSATVLQARAPAAWPA